MKNDKLVVISTCEEYKSTTIYKILKQQINFFNYEKFYNKKILLKPNLLSAQKPEKSVTTHPEFLSAVIRLFKCFNCRIFVGDSPSTLNFNEVIKTTGIKDVCEKENVEILNLTTYPKIEFEFNKFGLKKIIISKIVEDVDYIINLPKLKTHSLMFLTCGIKNMYGLVPGMTKAIYHRYALNSEDFFEILYTVYQYKKPELTIVDGIMGMDGEGPSGGNVKKFSVILTSDDAESVDWFILYKFFKKSTKFYDRILKLKKPNIIYHNFKSELEFKNFVFPQTTFFISVLPKWILNLIKPFFWFYPFILQEKCRKCGKCYDICPKKTIKYINKNYFVFRENCISCFCCLETCPYNAIKIQRSVVYELIFKLKDLISKLIK
ncbi:MAG: DUF362 domain-containing protein [Endomicrobiia bacterium]